MTDQEVVDFGSRFKPPTIPGVPTFKADNIVDAGRTTTFYRPIPTSSAGRRFQLTNKILGVYDRGNVGTVIEDERVLIDAETGEKYVKMVGIMYYIGQGNWGGPMGEGFHFARLTIVLMHHLGSSQPSYPPPKDKAPDAQHTYQVPENAALLYR